MFYGKFRGPEDREFMQQALARFREIFHRVYANDNVILFGRNMGYLQDPRFANAFKKNCHNQQERSLAVRLNTLTWAADQALAIDGDFVECGVFRGFCMGVVTDYVDFANVDKQLYLYDTYEGIPADYDTENHDSKLFRQGDVYGGVVERFAAYPNVHVIKGTVPDSFEQACPEKISFLHIDMNSSKSEIAALEVLFDRVTPGGFIIFDDYGWTGYRAQMVAEDAWMAERGHKILELPSGQGFLIKR